jgi:Dyp-type peroxidase family
MAPATDAELDDMQGLLRSAFRTLPSACFGVYTLSDAARSRTFLSRIAARVTSAAARNVPVATQVSLSATGLRAIGLPDAVVEGFSLEFQAGIATPARSRFLGDDPAAWTWGGPAGPQVDVLVCTYARTSEELHTAIAEIDAAAAEGGVAGATQLETLTLSPIEPFGFRDGISDPFVRELASSAQAADPPKAEPVPLGEFVLGYRNIYGLQTQRPVLPDSGDPNNVLPVLSPGADQDNPQGGADLGRNGSYLVLRTLAQDTAGFESHVREQAAASGLDAELLAAKMVGRWRSGAPLAMSHDRDRPDLAEANDFGYHDNDPLGLRCPIGAHIRRSNPRDSLDPQPGSAQSLAVTDRHRIMRRGRKFTDTDGGQGLHFVALNGNLGRQFEFVQHTWLNNPKFGGLYDDVDPLIGPRDDRSVFTVPARPVRRRFAGLPDFVTTVGGAYFFLPGIRALHYLCEGSW